MSRVLGIKAELEGGTPENEDAALTGNVVVSVASDTERDMAVKHDAEDLLLWVARVMGWSVTVDKQGGAGVDPGV